MACSGDLPILSSCKMTSKQPSRNVRSPSMALSLYPFGMLIYFSRSRIGRACFYHTILPLARPTPKLAQVLSFNLEQYTPLQISRRDDSTREPPNASNLSLSTEAQTT